jgi:hypothetical protein
MPHVRFSSMSQPQTLKVVLPPHPAIRPSHRNNRRSRTTTRKSPDLSQPPHYANSYSKSRQRANILMRTSKTEIGAGERRRDAFPWRIHPKSVWLSVEPLRRPLPRRSGDTELAALDLPLGENIFYRGTDGQCDIVFPFVCYCRAITYDIGQGLIM